MRLAKKLTISNLFHEIEAHVKYSIIITPTIITTVRLRGSFIFFKNGNFMILFAIPLLVSLKYPNQAPKLFIFRNSQQRNSQQNVANGVDRQRDAV